MDGRFLIKEGFHNATIIDYDCGFRTKFERKYRTVFLGPFCDSGSVSLARVDTSSMHQVSWSIILKMDSIFWDLMKVSNDG